jgi:hypothetical protein
MNARISLLVENNEVPYVPLERFERRTSRDGSDRIVADTRERQVDLLCHFVAALEEPLYLLYLLHTPRGEGAPGRYQSPKLTRLEARDFLVRHSDYLSADSRFDLWLHCPSSRTTVVWDRHNKLFGYGDLDLVESVLSTQGFATGRTEDAPSFPHVHHYRAEFDALALSVLGAFQWSHSPLHQGDEQ